MYDDTAKQLAVKVIGTIESNLNYGAINYGDPITVGIAQWYGTRAAAILDRMATENPSQYYGVEPSIASQLATIDSSDTFWNGRRLTVAEGDSLAGVLTRNAAIQENQLIADLEVYRQVLISHGWDTDTHTDTTIFFYAMYHQGPVYALQVINTLDPACTLDEMLTACLNNSVLGQYGSRYYTAASVIKDGTPVIVTPPATAPPVVPNGNARYIRQAGSILMVKFENQETVQFYPDGHGQWVPRSAATTPTPVQPPPPVTSGSTWVMPLAGSNVTISSPYGPRPTPAGSADLNNGFHYGCDFVHEDGTMGDILSPCPLVITQAWVYGTAGDPSSGTGGNYVKGHTLDGAYTFGFFHMAQGSLAVSVGDTTTTGQKIGTEGGTGNVTGPHLHFECYEGNLNNPWPPPYGNPIDPLPVLRAHGVNI